MNTAILTPADLGIITAKRDMGISMLRAQIVYRQGLVKDFIVPGDMTFMEFMVHANAFGKVRLLRSMRDVRDVVLEMQGGNVTLLLRSTP